MSLPNVSLSLGSMSMHRTMEASTLSAYTAFHADLNQFLSPDTVLRDVLGEAASGADKDEILVGEMSVAITFFDALPASALGNISTTVDLSDKFNDQVNFHVRVPAITRVMQKYLARLQAPLSEARIRGFTLIEDINVAAGFDEMDILAAGLNQLSVLTAASGDGLLWLHSDQDRVETQTELHQSMARQFRFRQEHPYLGVTTFPNIGPVAGTMAGLLAPAARWDAGDDWSEVRTRHAINPEWHESMHVNALQGDA